MREELCECIENNHQLTQIAAKDCNVLLAIRGRAVCPAIDIGDFIVDNVCHSLSLIDEVFFDLLSHLHHDLDLLLVGPFKLTLFLGGQLLLLLAHLVLTFLFVVLDALVYLLHVEHSHFVNVSCDTRARVPLQIFNFFHESLSTSHDPRHNILVHGDFPELILEEAEVLKQNV